MDSSCLLFHPANLVNPGFSFAILSEMGNKPRRAFQVSIFRFRTAAALPYSGHPMKTHALRTIAIFCTGLIPCLIAHAHEGVAPEFAITNVTPLPFVVETKGPVRAPEPTSLAAGQKASGQGFWKFVAARDLMPVPAAAQPKVVGAHGTLIVDKAADTVYWGLQGVGWIGFSNRLKDSWIVKGNPAFSAGNLHGADILPRGNKTPLVAATDNVSGKIYLTDTKFQNVETLTRPGFGTYATNQTFAPTDVAFTSLKELWIVDGYGQQQFLSADVSPFEWREPTHGGGEFSKTLHGVTFDKAQDDLLFSARPEGLLKRLEHKTLRAREILGLPAGTLLCDVDLWGDYCLCACLDGPNQTPGPLYIVNLKKRAIVSTIKPKEDLGYSDAQHIHDAAWYVTGEGRDQEVYLLFTNWNPGGIGALRLVNLPD